jgi:hypothetical protein
MATKISLTKAKESLHGRRAVGWVAGPQDDGSGDLLVSGEDGSGVGYESLEAGEGLRYDGSGSTEGGIITGWSERVDGSVEVLLSLLVYKNGRCGIADNQGGCALGRAVELFWTGWKESYG